MNRFHEIEEKRLIADLERICRRLPKGRLQASTAGVHKFPPVDLFSEIHGILDRLTRIRSMVLVPVKKGSDP